MDAPVPRTWPAVAALLASSLPEALLAAPPKLAPLHLSPNPSRLAGPHGAGAESAGFPSFAYGCSASSYPVNPNAKKQVRRTCRLVIGVCGGGAPTPEEGVSVCTSIVLSRRTPFVAHLQLILRSLSSSSHIAVRIRSSQPTL